MHFLHFLPVQVNQKIYTTGQDTLKDKRKKIKERKKVNFIDCAVK